MATRLRTDVERILGEDVHIPGLSRWADEIDERGFVVIEDWLTSERLQRLGRDLRRDVLPRSETLPPEHLSVRSHNLLAKTRGIDDLACDPRLVAVAQRVIGHRVQISATTIFDLLPGASAQALHQDDGLWPIPRPHPTFVCNAIVVVEDFTADNGATHVVAGSHRWHDRAVVQPPDIETVQIEARAGSAILFDGALWHGGGANRTRDGRLALNINFNASYLAQQENQFVAVPRSELAAMPEPLRRVLGYQRGPHPAGPGMVDMRDPLTMLDLVTPGYDINNEAFPTLSRTGRAGTKG